MQFKCQKINALLKYFCYTFQVVNGFAANMHKKLTFVNQIDLFFGTR